MTYRIACSLSLSLFLVPACGGMTGPTDTGVPNDGEPSLDGGPHDGGGLDAGADGGPVDGGGVDGGSDGGTEDAPTADAGMCGPTPTDLSPLGMDCADAACPAGFTCQGFSGVVFQQSCAILCEPEGCPCPPGTHCTGVSDKGGSWFECRPLPG